MVILGATLDLSLVVFLYFNNRLKLKRRILDYGSSVILLPIIILSFKPEIPRWDLFNITAVPVFVVFIICTMMTKKELGYYFYKEKTTVQI